MNKILKILVSVDIISLSAFGLLAPVFAIFIKKNISGGTIATAGIATAVYLVTKPLFQILVAKYTDADKGNKREVYTIFVGYILSSFIPLFYIFANSIEQIYLIQFFNGIFVALCFPGWNTLFTRYINNGKEGMRWTIYEYRNKFRNCFYCSYRRINSRLFWI